MDDNVNIDNINLKLKITKVIENSQALLEKSTMNIIAELAKMKEEHSILVSKFFICLEKDGYSLDNPNVNSRKTFKKHISNEVINSGLHPFIKIRGKKTINIPSSKLLKKQIDARKKVENFVNSNKYEESDLSSAVGHKLNKTKSFDSKKRNNHSLNINSSRSSRNNLKEIGQFDLKSVNLVNKSIKFSNKFTLLQDLNHSVGSPKLITKIVQPNFKKVIKVSGFKTSQSIAKDSQLKYSTPISNKIKNNLFVDNIDKSLNDNLSELSQFTGISVNRYAERKLSILDISGPLVNVDNQSEKKTTEDYKALNLINKKYKFNFLKNKMEKFIFTICSSDVVPLKTRIIFCRANKEVSSLYSLNDVMRDYTLVLSKNIFKKANYLFTYSFKESIINKPFIPSLTAQNGLNFITKESANILLQSLTNEKSNDVISTCKFVLGLVYKDNNIFIDSLSEHLVQNAFLKLNVDSFKTLFKTPFVNRNILYMSNEQYNSIVNIVQENPNIVDPGKIFKSNKILSYLTFIIKEIYDFLTKKTEDGVLVLYLRKQNFKLSKMKEKLKFLSGASNIMN